MLSMTATRPNGASLAVNSQNHDVLSCNLLFANNASCMQMMRYMCIHVFQGSSNLRFVIVVQPEYALGIGPDWTKASERSRDSRAVPNAKAAGNDVNERPPCKNMHMGMDTYRMSVVELQNELA